MLSYVFGKILTSAQIFPLPGLGITFAPVMGSSIGDAVMGSSIGGTVLKAPLNPHKHKNHSCFLGGGLFHSAAFQLDPIIVTWGHSKST